MGGRWGEGWGSGEGLLGGEMGVCLGEQWGALEGLFAVFLEVARSGDGKQSEPRGEQISPGRSFAPRRGAAVAARSCRTAVSSAESR